MKNNKEDKTMMNLKIEKLKNLSLAALLIVGAAFTACSSSDDITTETPQPINPTGKYTMTIQASKDDGATTRALSLEVTSEIKLKATWNAGEEVLVYQNGSKIGTLTAAASPTALTTLSGTLDSTPDANQALTFYFHTAAAPSYDGQDGTLAQIASTYDFCEPATVAPGGFTVDAVNHKITVPSDISFGANKQAIIRFKLEDKNTGDPLNTPSALTVSDGISTVSLTDIPAATYYTVNHYVNVLYVAFPAAGSAKTITLTATAGDDIYTYTTSTAKTLTNGQYYEITVKMTKNEIIRPLTLEAIEDGTIKVEFYGELTLPEPITYTKNGEAGGSITSTTEIPVSAGEKVCLYSKNSSLGYHKVENSTPYDKYIHITTTNSCYIYGNVMSLIDDSGSGFANDKVIANNTAGDWEYWTFFRLFYNADKLETHPTNHIQLPATTLAMNCYYEMFNSCSRLTTVPLLPAETLADGCYVNMFRYCTSLTTAPELRATTLASDCCSGMFRNCTNLIAAPVLRAENLVINCYGNMFNGCTNLKYVKCLATNISAQYCLDYWLNGVSASGTFVKASGATWAEAGTNGIPSGWTVQNAE